MKNSSMKTAPNGSTPPITTVVSQPFHHAVSGTCRGILFVRTGSSGASLRYPTKLPTNVNGTLTPNHRNINANRLQNGTAPLDRCPHTKKFNSRNTVDTSIGNANAALVVVRFHCVILNDLYARADAYPLNTPLNTNKKIPAVPRLPRFAGLSTPITLSTILPTTILNTCVPVPTHTANQLANFGGRKTSPCTSFQPVSSAASSAVSRSLYAEMSLRSVRSMIIATIPVKNSSTINELTMLNQCTSFDVGIVR